MKITAAPADFDFSSHQSDLDIALYSRPNGRQGSAGKDVLAGVRRARLQPASHAWDLLSFALAVVTADLAGHRAKSPDGWTREFDLTVAVGDRQFWTAQVPRLSQLLSYLTTDIWRLHFVEGGLIPTPHRRVFMPDTDCVTLLSGGLDSFIGALDLAAAGRKPTVVSQVVRGDADKQCSLAAMIGDGLHHLQFNHNAQAPGQEGVASQRARSIIFLAYGVLAATSLAKYHAGDPVDLYVCENGFISINPPLTPLRLGSLSTRTSHPVVLAHLQDVLQQAGLRVRICCPYQHKTKGEMLIECRDQPLLLKKAHGTTSCGRYLHFNYKHCGRCLPCLIRRSAFAAWRVPDRTKYVYREIGRKDAEHSGFDDVRAAAMAVVQAREEGFDRWLGSALSSSLVGNRAPHRAVVERGLAELATFLRSRRVA